MNFWTATAIVLLTIGIMEGLAWVIHKYILHGPLWFVHKTHHGPRKGWWEANDWVSVVYGLLSAALVVWGDLHAHPVFWVGIGIMAYGMLYFLLHDVIVHQRVRFRHRFGNLYLQRIIRAHKIHHKHMGRAGSEAFGFLYARRRYTPKKLSDVDPK